MATKKTTDKPKPRRASSRGTGQFAELRALATLADAIQGRARLANVAGVTFGGKRDLYETLGYDRDITPVQYRSRYRRDAVAKRIVEGFPIDTWRGGFELVDNQDLDKSTKFEAAWERLANRLNLVDTFKQVDILARIGRYAVLVVGAPGEADQPLTACTEKNLAYVSLYAEEDAAIQEYDTDTKSPRFGLPTFYQIKRKTAKAGTAQKVVNLDKRVHYTRVFHVAENLLEDRVFGTPALECVWNLLDDLAKVTGGGAEAFWQRANQGMHVDIDPSLNPGAGELEAMRESIEKYRHRIDRVLRTRGAKINMLGSDTADIKGPQGAIVEQISAGTGYPARVLMGSEQGKLAAEQDSVKYYRMCEGRRIGYAETIVRNFVAWMVKLGVLPKPQNDEFEVRWSQLQAMDDSEKADLAVKLNTLNTNGEVVVTGDELREVLGREPLAEVDPEADANNKAGGTPPAPGAPAPAGQEPTVAAGKEPAAWKKIHRAADRFRPKATASR